MKKKLSLLSIVALATTLVACEVEEEYINYKDEELPVSEVEEKIADELEVENSDLDMEVDIYEEVED
ncbi:hypothetical protein [Bacillus sp. JJ722]|uniref:hypothetical protein n=1 Tax=Bacillus sp. JJ722 TaxID=3122973 RepID=UPI002FFD5EE2